MINVNSVIRILKKEYPHAKIALHFKNIFQLLVVVILSAQCTDKQVNKISPALFAKFSTVKDFAQCDLHELEKYIRSTGFYKNKAKNIKGAAGKIISDFGGKVPDKMEDLLKLPGVARKTANVILSSGYGRNEGIVVDTHVIRLSGLLGFVPKALSEKKNAVKIEEKLMKIIPKSDWGDISHLLIFHGRNVCVARRPKCDICPLNKICPSAFYWMPVAKRPR
ncbi:MAG: endonuclease III [Candidatus Peregrinibacteria bacterium]